jgi:hypothetical protein
MSEREHWLILCGFAVILLTLYIGLTCGYRIGWNSRDAEVKRAHITYSPFSDNGNCH